MSPGHGLNKQTYRVFFLRQTRPCRHQQLLQRQSVCPSKHMAQASSAPRPCYCSANNILSQSEAESRQTEPKAIPADWGYRWCVRFFLWCLASFLIPKNNINHQLKSGKKIFVQILKKSILIEFTGNFGNTNTCVLECLRGICIRECARMCV